MFESFKLFAIQTCTSGRRPLYGEIVWCKYRHSPWWPAIIVPPPCIPDRVRIRRTEPNTICVFFFGTHDFGWVYQTSIYLYDIKGDGERKNKTKNDRLKNAMDEAEQWIQRFDEMFVKSGKRKLNMHKNKPPPYKKIKANKLIAKFTNYMDYKKCKCCPADPAPCTNGSICENFAIYVECNPDLCPAKDKCQNQNLQRGEHFKFQVKLTDSKGWGLYTLEKIPADKFVIEYMGEVIDNVEFNQRFTHSIDNKDENYYFLTIGNNLYIDSTNYGNEARFINHSCDPNVKPMKWTVFSNGQEQTRIGFFAVRNILPVRFLIFILSFFRHQVRFYSITERGNNIQLQLGQKCQ